MRKILTAAVLLAMMTVLVGCDSSNYKEAVSMQEAKDYAQAIVLFEKLGEYEDSQTRLTQCRLEYAKVLMDKDAYAQAREQLLMLEPTEEVQMCLYQTAWNMLGAYLEEEGPMTEQTEEYNTEENSKTESICQFTKQRNTVVAEIRTSEEENLGLGIMYYTVTDTTVSFDGRNMQPVVKAEAEMKMGGTEPFQNVGTSTWDLTSYTAGTLVEWDEYIHIYKGEMHTDRYAPAFDERVTAQQTLIAGCLDSILQESGLGLTMADMGFENY